MGDAADDMYEAVINQRIIKRWEGQDMDEQDQYTVEQMIKMLRNVQELLTEALIDIGEDDTPEDIIELTQEFRDSVYEFDLAVEAYENGEVYEQE